MEYIARADSCEGRFNNAAWRGKVGGAVWQCSRVTQWQPQRSPPPSSPSPVSTESGAASWLIGKILTRDSHQYLLQKSFNLVVALARGSWCYWTSPKVFLHGYLWFGFCGAAGALGVLRAGRAAGRTMTRAHELAVWVASSIGLSCLAAQLYMHNYQVAPDGQYKRTQIHNILWNCWQNPNYRETIQ